MAEDGTAASGATAQQPLKVTDVQLGIRSGIVAAEGIELDLGNLTAYDPSAAATRDEATVQAQATALTQALMNGLLQLPAESTAAGRVAALPAPSTPLPRAKPLPKPREPTKWERFAQQKGIVKRKRSKLVFDEAEQTWKRRYGYDRANGGPPVVEAKASDQVGSDPFTEERAAKKQRVKKNQERHLANLADSSGKGVGGGKGKSGTSGGVPASVALAASLPEHGRGRPTKRTQMQPLIKAAAQRAGKSTASMGKFDKQPAGEKGKAAKPGLRKKALPVAAKNSSERASQKLFVEKLIGEKSL